MEVGFSPVHILYSRSWLPGIIALGNWETKLKPTTQMLMNMCQNSSLNAPGFFSQNTNMYRKSVLALKSMKISITTIFLATKCPKQTQDGSGPAANLIVNKLWTKLYQTIPFQLKDDTILLMIVRWWSESNFSNHMMEYSAGVHSKVEIIDIAILMYLYGLLESKTSKQLFGSKGTEKFNFFESMMLFFFPCFGSQLLLCFDWINISQVKSFWNCLLQYVCVCFHNLFLNNSFPSLICCI